MLSKLMSVVTIGHEASEGLLSVIQTMFEKHYCCVLICEYDKPTGITTERDIPRLFATHGLKKGVTAGDVMNRDPERQWQHHHSQSARSM
ncbi:MAG: CBS domain-containing protein [Glaciecola sp.]|jgi:CBS domain-containing protein